MIISIWGSSASGKTLLSTRMGVLLAKQKKRVLIIYTEMMAVDIAWIYPKEKNFVSMGELWQQENEEIYKYFMPVPSYDNMAYLSYKPSENIFSYPVFTKFNVVKTLTSLHEIFEYIIVDCASDISGNMISTVALEMADIVYRLAGTGIKDNFFFDSNLSLISDSRFNANNHITVLSNTKFYEPVHIYRMNYSNIKYELEFEEKLYFHVLEGGAASIINSKYDKTVARMIGNDLK